MSTTQGTKNLLTPVPRVPRVPRVPKGVSCMSLLPQEMINKIIYKHKAIETPSAKAMKTLITQVQESMDSFSAFGKDINYYMAMLGYMKKSTPESMWAHYLLGYCRDIDEMPDCWLDQTESTRHSAYIYRLREGHFCYDYSMLYDFPEEWEQAELHVDIFSAQNIGLLLLTDDPKDLTYWE